MAQVFGTKRRVEFRDTDAAGIVHFSVFFAYMEQAEHEFLRSLDLGVIMDVDDQRVSWPRVNAQCNYRSALRFEQVVDIEISVVRLGNKSVTYGFRFHRDNEVVADGTITAACCVWQEDEPPRAIPVPDIFRHKLAPYVAS